MGSGVGAPTGFSNRAPCQESGERTPQAESYLSFGRPTETQNLSQTEQFDITSRDIGRARWPTARHAKSLVTQLRYLLSISVSPSNTHITTLHNTPPKSSRFVRVTSYRC